MLKKHWHKLAGLGLGGVLALGAPAVAFADDTGDKFDKLDANGDGKISAAEFDAGKQKRFQEMDTNADGKITSAELNAAKGAQGSATEKVDKWDSNGDGALSVDEWSSGSKEKFDAWDTDGDGSLSRSEVSAGMASKKEGKKEGASAKAPASSSTTTETKTTKTETKEAD
jgi:Ca2+-binding EF-hand superfamily protein